MGHSKAWPPDTDLTDSRTCMPSRRSWVSYEGTCSASQTCKGQGAGHTTDDQTTRGVLGMDDEFGAPGLGTVLYVGWARIGRGRNGIGSGVGELKRSSVRARNRRRTAVLEWVPSRRLSYCVPPPAITKGMAPVNPGTAACDHRRHQKITPRGKTA